MPAVRRSQALFALVCPADKLVECFEDWSRAACDPRHKLRKWNQLTWTRITAMDTSDEEGLCHARGLELGTDAGGHVEDRGRLPLLQLPRLRVSTVRFDAAVSSNRG